MIGAHHEHACKLPLGARGRLQGGRRETSNRRQQLLQLEHDGQRALDGFVGLQGMDVADARQPGHVLVDARVVFHGAGAQRVEDGVDGEVALREMREVADDVQLTHFGQAQIRAQHLPAEIVHLGHVEGGQLVTRRAGPRHFRQQRLGLHASCEMADRGRHRTTAASASTS